MTCSTLRKPILVLSMIFFTGSLFAQKTELMANGYGGLFSFYGNGSVSSATGEINAEAFYGRHPGFAYSFELQVQRVTRQKHLYGLGLSIDKVKSRTNTTPYTINIGPSNPPPPPPATKTILSNSFLTMNPYIGHQFTIKRITLDVDAGLDLAYYLKGYVIIKTPSTKGKDFYSFPRNEVTPSMDIRSRVQINARYKRFGLLAGYSLGLTDYKKEAGSKAYASFVRMGISFRLK